MTKQALRHWVMYYCYSGLSPLFSNYCKKKANSQYGQQVDSSFLTYTKSKSNNDNSKFSECPLLSEWIFQKQELVSLVSFPSFIFMFFSWYFKLPHSLKTCFPSCQFQYPSKRTCKVTKLIQLSAFGTPWYHASLWSNLSFLAIYLD